MRASPAHRFVAAAALLMLIGPGRSAVAQTAENVLVVVNDRTPSGDQIARHYVQRRALPSSNVCHLAATTDETISRADYARTIESPIWRCLAKGDGQDRILYIVLTKGIPLRIDGTLEHNGTVASVDSELALLYRRRAGYAAGLAGSVANPYFARSTPPAEWKPFSHRDHDIFLVTRLDGYTVDDAIALIDRSLGATRDGRVLLDGRAALTADPGNRWLSEAADRLRSSGFEQVVLDETSRVIVHEARVVGYYSWGTNDRAIRIRHFDLAFVPGALAAMFVSSDARTLKEPPASWTPGEWEDRKTFFGGTPQSLTADLIRDGVTGAAGHVGEPYLNATIRPDILFPAYTRGMNLAEAFYLAMPFLSWQTIVFGDPLCAPFRSRGPSESELNPAIDEALASPAYFGPRRVAALPERVNLDARRAYVRSEALGAHGDATGQMDALKAAVAADPQFTGARFSKATVHEQRQDIDLAIAEYRAILAYAPNEAAALNNLAFDLAARKGGAVEALPLAQRAVALMQDAPTSLDTLAWVQHVLGQHGEATATIARAAAGAPANAEIRWHAAVIYADAREYARAADELNALLKIDASASDRAEVRQLRARIDAARK